MAFWKKKKKQTTAKKKTPATSPKTDSPKMKPVPEWKPTISMPTYKPPSAENEDFDPEKGLAMAIAKKALGNKGSYFNKIKRWTNDYHEES